MTHTVSLKRLAATLLAAAASAIGAQAALGSPPDAFERALASELSLSRAGVVDDYFRDPTASVYPDDRALRGGHPVAGEAAGVSVQASGPDAFQRAVAAGPAAYLGGVLPEAAGDGFDWGDFGIGMAAMAGAVLLLAGLAAGGLAAREARSGRLGRA
jgi:hypothetical protein